MTLPSTDREAIDRLKLHFSKFQIADKDGDLDRDPYTSAAWNGNAFSNGATGTINWVTAFGLPEIPQAVWVEVHLRDADSSAGDYHIAFRAKVTTTRDSATCRCDRENNDNLDNHQRLIPVADNGTSYYSVVASGVNTMDVWIRVIAWMK